MKQNSYMLSNKDAATQLLRGFMGRLHQAITPERGLSQSMLAQAIGMIPSSLSRMLNDGKNGTAFMSSLMLFRIAAATRMKIVFVPENTNPSELPEGSIG